MEISLSPSGKIQKFCFNQNTVNLLLILSALAFWACSRSVWINKSRFFNINLPLLCESSDLAVIRSCASTAFHGGSKCDDSYFRQKHTRKAQIRRHSL